MEPKDQLTLLLALYKENCDQSRHHEVQRERVTSIVAQTTGIIVGLFGFATSWANPSPVRLVIPAFLILLGLWGYFGAWRHYGSRFHVQRVRQCRSALKGLSGIDLSAMNDRAKAEHLKDFPESSLWEPRAHIIWKPFPLFISLIGFVLLAYLLFAAR
jgi:hypothetical protein